MFSNRICMKVWMWWSWRCLQVFFVFFLQWNRWLCSGASSSSISPCNCNGYSILFWGGGAVQFVYQYYTAVLSNLGSLCVCVLNTEHPPIKWHFTALTLISFNLRPLEWTVVSVYLYFINSSQSICCIGVLLGQPQVFFDTVNGINGSFCDTSCYHEVMSPYIHSHYVYLPE